MPKEESLTVRETPWAADARGSASPSIWTSDSPTLWRRT